MARLAERPTGPKSGKGRQTRDRLLVAAKVVFEEDGFLDARISDIADRAGLSYGSFYHYFSSKEEIFREVAAAHERALGAAVAADTEHIEGADAATVTSRFTAANRRFLAGYRSEARLMRVIEQVTRYDADLDRARTERRSIFARRLAEAIAQLQREGAADPAVDPVIGSQAITAMVTRFAEAWFGEGRIDRDFDEAVDQLNRICINALRLRG